MAEALCAIMLLEDSSPRQALADFLLARKLAIQQLLNQPHHGQCHGAAPWEGRGEPSLPLLLPPQQGWGIPINLMVTETLQNSTKINGSQGLKPSPPIMGKQGDTRLSPLPPWKGPQALVPLTCAEGLPWLKVTSLQVQVSKLRCVP